MPSPYHMIFVLAMVFFACLQGTGSVCAQGPDFNFEHLTTEHGLSSNKVTSIIQDREGFYWIATQNGLNRYEGTSFRVYRHIAADSSSLTHNSCTSLAEGLDGDIWVGTYMGISRFVREEGRFQQIYLHHPFRNFELANRVTNLSVDKKGDIWIGSHGLYKYDVALDTLLLFLPDSINPASISDASTIGHMVYDSVRHGIWCSTVYHLNYLDITTGEFYNEGHNPPNWRVFDFAEASELALNHGDLLWFIARDNFELSCFDIAKNELIVADNPVAEGLRQMYTDNDGRVWLSFWARPTVIFDPAIGKTEGDLFEMPDSRSILNGIVTHLFIDKQKNHWIASGSGISIYHVNNQYYKIHTLSGPDLEPRYDGLHILAMAQTNPDHVWIGTHLGLFRYHLSSGEIRRIPVNSEKPRISSLWANNDCLWVGIHEGVICLDTANQKEIQRFPLGPGAIFIRQDVDDKIWVGMWTNGLFRIDPATKELTHFTTSGPGSGPLRSNGLVSVCPDEDDIWIGYNGAVGFSRLHRSTFTFDHFHPLEHESARSRAGTITVICKDQETMWLGTYGNGVYRFDAANGTYSGLDHEPGLRSPFINSIVSDENGGLWISTADGMNWLNTRQNTLSQIDIDLVFDDNDFVPNGIRGLNGKLYFFCKNKFVEITPELYRYGQNEPHIVVSSFRVFDREVVLPTREPTISLSHRENFFSFEYALLKTHPAKEVRYAHRLQGFDPDWHVGMKNFASYTNVPGGQYFFEVKATNPEGQWSDVLLSLPVYIAPPFWRTWWFVTLCILVTVGGIMILYQYRISQIRKIYAIRSRISQDLHDDVGASLSGIYIYSSVAEKALKNDLQKAGEIVQLIKHNSRQVLESMGDIVWSMNTGTHAKESLADRIMNYGYDLLSQKNIECSYQIDEQVEKKLRQPDTRKKVLLLVKEAMNNMAKYSEATHAQVRIVMNGTGMLVHIEDNGKGFDPGQVKKGNGLQNMKERSVQLGGTFQLRSSPGGGTCIDSHIPLR